MVRLLAISIRRHLQVARRLFEPRVLRLRRLAAFVLRHLEPLIADALQLTQQNGRLLLRKDQPIGVIVWEPRMPQLGTIAKQFRDAADEPFPVWELSAQLPLRKCKHASKLPAR